MQRDMVRTDGRPATPLSRMALLGLAELTLSFAAIYALAHTAGGAAWMPSVVHDLSQSGAEMAALVTLTLGLVGLVIGLYRPEVCDDRTRLLVAAATATATAFCILMLLAGGMGQGFSAAQIATIAPVIGVWLLTMGIMRLVVRLAFRGTMTARRILLLGDPSGIDHFQAQLHARHGSGFEPVVLPAQELTWPMIRRRKIWGVVLASEPEHGKLDALLDCKMRGARVISSAAFHERHLGRIDLDSLTARAMLASDGFAAHRVSAMVKRVCDIAFSLMMITLTLPLMLLTALAIKADDPGPVLYRQQRIGAFGKSFTVIKFRSMTTDAEAGGKPRWAQKHDPRITRVGRFIRATRIDELPQLVNVIRGDMSLVGPRPERPLFVEQLTQAIPFYHQRSYVKPGLTGWAQVNYPYGASVEDAREKLAYDLYYVKHRSFWLDVRILVATIRVVLFREGAR